MKRDRGSDGFTLLELVISISILVILVSMVTPIFTKQIEKARQQRCITEAKSVYQALQLYLLDMEEAGIEVKREELTYLMAEYPVTSPKNLLYPYLSVRITREAYLVGQGFGKDGSAANLKSIEYMADGYIIMVEKSGNIEIRRENIRVK